MFANTKLHLLTVMENQVCLIVGHCFKSFQALS